MRSSLEASSRRPADCWTVDVGGVGSTGAGGGVYLTGDGGSGFVGVGGVASLAGAGRGVVSFIGVGARGSFV